MESQVRLYRTTEGIFVEEDGNFFAVDATDRDRFPLGLCLHIPVTCLSFAVARLN
jgi:hypothetical protein